MATPLSMFFGPSRRHRCQLRVGGAFVCDRYALASGRCEIHPKRKDGELAARILEGADASWASLARALARIRVAKPGAALNVAMRRLPGGRSRRRLTIMLIVRGELRCYWCGEVLDMALHGTSDPRAPTVEHLQPVSLGGSDDPSNLDAACLACNSERGSRLDFPRRGHSTCTA